MSQRGDFTQASPGAYRAMRGLEKQLSESSIELSLRELVKMRVSQINGCAYCIDMHSKDARAAGETEQRLYGLSAWKEAPYYTPRERAALLWAETLTRIADTQEVSDEVYERARAEFSEEELADLTLTVVTINGWNRFVLAFRPEIGHYQPAKAPE